MICWHQKKHQIISHVDSDMVLARMVAVEMASGSKLLSGSPFSHTQERFLSLIILLFIQIIIIVAFFMSGSDMQAILFIISGLTSMEIISLVRYGERLRSQRIQ